MHAFVLCDECVCCILCFCRAVLLALHNSSNVDKKLDIFIKF